MTKIVIDIPDEDYKFIKDLQFYNSGRRSGKTIERNVINAIKNSTPYEERPIVEKIVTKGGMTLALRKPDREISDFANVIADMLGDINVRELKDKFNTITFTDNNSSESVSYCRVEEQETEND